MVYIYCQVSEPDNFFAEETIRVLKLSLTEFSLPKFYQLYGISKVKSAAVSAFRSTFRTGDRSFVYQHAEQERMSLANLEIVTDALLEIMEVRKKLFSKNLFSKSVPKEL